MLWINFGRKRDLQKAENSLNPSNNAVQFFYNKLYILSTIKRSFNQNVGQTVHSFGKKTAGYGCKTVRYRSHKTTRYRSHKTARYRSHIFASYRNLECDHLSLSLSVTLFFVGQKSAFCRTLFVTFCDHGNRACIMPNIIG